MEMDTPGIQHASATQTVGRSKRPEIEWTIAERVNMLRHSVAKAEAVFASVIFAHGMHILLFDHAHDPIAKAMISFLDCLPLWGLSALVIGCFEMYGAYSRNHSIREWSVFCNLGFTMFAWFALLRSHTWTPGVLVFGAYIFWLFEILCYLRKFHDEQFSN